MPLGRIPPDAKLSEETRAALWLHEIDRHAHKMAAAYGSNPTPENEAAFNQARESYRLAKEDLERLQTKRRQAERNR